jgi:CBS domain containing-hemolysin-like protein
MSIALGLALILVLTAATGYFVAQEFAYVAVDRNQLRRLAEDGDPAAERASRVTSQLSFTLSAAQFGITVTALLVGYVSEPLVGRGLADALGFTDLSYAARLSLSVTAVLVFSTVVQMVFGELAPKNLAIARTVPMALALSRSTLAYLKVIGPLVRLFDRASTALLRRVGIEPVEELEHGATAEDLTRIIDESHAGGLLDDDLSEVLEGGLRFRELDAGDVMTPRVRVRTIGADATVADLVDLLDTGYSRFPVTGVDGDDILGVVGMAEVLSVPRAERPHTTVGSLVTEPTVVPTSAPLPRVLEQIRTDRRQLAVVVDEHGGFAGVVAFEDIAEEVVGEILDEDETEVPGVRETDSGWTTPGHLRLDELETATGLELTTADEYATISGFVMERLGRTPTVGDVVETTARRELGAPREGADARRSADEHLERAHERAHEREWQRPEVGVRITVTDVHRHVPRAVLVEVHDLFEDLQALDASDSADALETAGAPEGADRARTAGTPDEEVGR